MKRRTDPRPVSDALSGLVDRLAPATPLVEIQRVWESVVGPQLAAVSRPRSERQGHVVVECQAGVWAEELSLMQLGVMARINAAVGRELVTEVQIRGGDVSGRS